MSAHAIAFTEVTALLQDYFDGLHHGDTERLARVFHPQAVYATAAPPKPLILDMVQYFPIVQARPSPASRGEARRDEILSIEFAGPVTALAKVRCAIGPRHFHDLLSLIRTDGRWQVIAKVFHYSEVEADAAPKT